MCCYWKWRKDYISTSFTRGEDSRRKRGHIIYLENDPLRRYFKSYEFKDKLLLKDIFTIGITGSCGKTSTCLYIYYFLKRNNVNVCYIGTHKIYYYDLSIETNNTTLEVDNLYYYFTKYNIKPDVIVMEVSSHGINQARINNFKFDIVGLTNLGSDHLDYHLCLKNYHNVKNAFLLKNVDVLKIFIPKIYKKLINKNNKIKYYKVNKNIFNNYKVVNYDYNNLYLSYLILKAMKYKSKEIINTLRSIKLNNGRGEIIYHNNRKIVIDYAHHIESFETILNDNNYNKVVVFGCGGNRDKIKRSIMGEIACKYCKHVIITIDNPRNESLDDIILDITKNIKNYIVIKDRYNAIEYAINKYNDLDIYVLGKGDETFIEINNKKIPFNDKEVVNKIINKD